MKPLDCDVLDVPAVKQVRDYAEVVQRTVEAPVKQAPRRRRRSTRKTRRLGGDDDA